MRDISATAAYRDGRNIQDGYFRGTGIEFGSLHDKITNDEDYKQAMIAAADRTIAHPYRLFNLFLLVKYYLPKIGFGHIVEFGAYKGGTAFFMGILAKRLLPGVQVYALDTFQGMPPTDGGIDAHNVGDFNDTSLEEIFSAQKQLGIDNVHFVAGLFENTVPAVLPRVNQIALAHIDCDILSSVRYSYECVKPYMVPKGYLVFDDSTASTCIGATEAVERFVIQRDGLLSEQIFPHHVFRAP